VTSGDHFFEYLSVTFFDSLDWWLQQFGSGKNRDAAT